MDEGFALSIVDKCEYAVLSTTDDDGAPYSVPLTIVRKDKSIYFHCAMEGTKTELLKTHPRVCMVCVGDTKRATDKFTTGFESAVLFGTASEVTADDEKIEALRILCQRHTPENMENFDEAIKRSLTRTAIWRVQIESITGKRKVLK